MGRARRLLGRAHRVVVTRIQNTVRTDDRLVLMMYIHVYINIFVYIYIYLYAVRPDVMKLKTLSAQAVVEWGPPTRLKWDDGEEWIRVGGGLRLS